MKTLDEILLEAEEKMEKSLDFLHQQFNGLRTGKASTSLVENLTASYYGSKVRLLELSNITTPEPRLVVINAFDPTALPAIEKAIIAANLGVTPLNDGRVIRIPIPELSEERRKELIKVARQITEKARVAARSIRQESNEQVKGLEKESDITEDEKKQGLDTIQKLTDDCISKMDEMLAGKEKEMLNF